MAGPKQHRMVYNALLQRILSGEYAAGSKLPTQQEICAEFDVSRPTVIHALNDLKAHGHIGSIQGLGSFVHAATETEQRLGLIIPGGLHQGKESIFPALQHQIMREAARLGWQILLGDSSGVDQKNFAMRQPVELARRLIKSGVRTAIFVPHALGGRGEAFNNNVLAELSAANVSVVLFDRDIVEYPMRSSYDLVCMDNFHAGQIVGKHLLAVGARRVAFIRTAFDFPTPGIRLDGLRRALAKENCKLPPQNVFNISPIGQTDLKKILKTVRPDAIVCDSDHDAAPVMVELLKLGVKIPQDIKIASFDDAPIACLLPVPLTTVSLPAEALAFKAIETLRDRRERKILPPVTVQVQCKLVVRESTTGR